MGLKSVTQPWQAWHVTQPVASCDTEQPNAIVDMLWMHQYTEFVFFYPTSWNYIPVCLNVRELFTVVEPLLQFVKVNACHDIALLTHVCHIGRADLNEVCHYAPSHPISTKLMSIWRQSSLVKRNLGAVWTSGGECFAHTSFQLCQWPVQMQHSMLRFGMYWKSMIRRNAGGCMASGHGHICCTWSWGFVMLKWQGKFVVSSCMWWPGHLFQAFHVVQYDICGEYLGPFPQFILSVFHCKAIFIVWWQVNL